MRRAKAELMRKINGALNCQIVHCMARLGVADALYTERLTLEGLSERCDVPSENLHRLIQALIALHLIHAEIDGTYTLTEEGALLASEHPDSQRAIALYKGSPILWRPLEKLAEGLSSDQSPFELAYGTDLFSHLEKHPEDAACFHNAMAAYERQSSQHILSLYDFSPYRSVIDIGGGRGGFLSRLLKLQPQLTGSLFDLPQALREVRFPELKLIPGSFFDEIPTGYDIYLMRNILHDWDDERATRILNVLHEAIGVNGRLLLFETLIDKSPAARLGRFSDLNMFLQTPGGRERSEEELQGLLESCGFHITGILRTTGAKALIEAQLHSA